MAATTANSTPVSVARRRVGTRALQPLWRFARQQPLGMVGLVLVVLTLVVAAFGQWLATHNPDSLSADILVGPSADHWFGTDANGRDYYSRVVSGARITVALSVVAVTVGFGTGTALGMISAYYRGAFDLIFQRLIDAFLAVPGIILALFLVAVLGRDTINLILILSVLIIPGVIRFARGTSLQLLSSPYIEAAEVLGAGTPRILFRHLLPNLLPSVAVVVTTSVGGLLLVAAGLSFLGLGVQPPTAEWGRMLSESRQYALSYPHLAIFPGVGLSLAVLGVNLLGDALRDVWDPRLRTL